MNTCPAGPASRNVMLMATTGSVSLGFDGVIGIQLNEARKIAVVERQISDPFMTSYELGSQDVGGGIHPLYPIGRFLIGVPF